MRVVWTLGVFGVVLGACVPMRTLKGSTATYLTPAGSRVAVNRPVGTVAATVQELFAERGFPLVNRAQVSPTNLVLFFRGGRISPGYQSGSVNPSYGAAASQVGSWFAVRVTDEGAKSTASFFGKPTVNGTEVCGDGDDQLRDAQYRCVEVRVREDWPATQLVEGREETQIISSVIASLLERLPER